MKRDRLNFDLHGLRERLEAALVEPGQSLGSVLRQVANLGLDLLEACRRLKLPPPRLGEVEKWLMEISGIHHQSKANEETFAGLLSGLDVEEISESGIPFERILLIKRGSEPEPHEITKLARVLGKTPSEIKQLIKKKYVNGNGH
ncbi:MAG: hypothetical protein PUP92_21285 [Rhizonema sp. PD38]|nr:hypothetical protein [Rhizonema sp. PD38]